jgi:hypothetical protein
VVRVHAGQRGIGARAVGLGREDALPHTHRARLVPLIQQLLAQRDEVRRVARVDAHQLLHLTLRELGLPPARVELGQRLVHRRVAAELAAGPGRQAQGLLALPGLHEQLRQLHHEARLARGAADQLAVLRDDLVQPPRAGQQLRQPHPRVDVPRVAPERAAVRHQRLLFVAQLVVQPRHQLVLFEAPAATGLELGDQLGQPVATAVGLHHPVVDLGAHAGLAPRHAQRPLVGGDGLLHLPGAQLGLPQLAQHRRQHAVVAAQRGHHALVLLDRALVVAEPRERAREGSALVDAGVSPASQLAVVRGGVVEVVGGERQLGQLFAQVTLGLVFAGERERTPERGPCTGQVASRCGEPPLGAMRSRVVRAQRRRLGVHGQRLGAPLLRLVQVAQDHARRIGLRVAADLGAQLRLQAVHAAVALAVEVHQTLKRERLARVAIQDGAVARDQGLGALAVRLAARGLPGGAWTLRGRAGLAGIVGLHAGPGTHAGAGPHADPGAHGGPRTHPRRRLHPRAGPHGQAPVLGVGGGPSREREEQRGAGEAERTRGWQRETREVEHEGQDSGVSGAPLASSALTRRMSGEVRDGPPVAPTGSVH